MCLQRRKIVFIREIPIATQQMQATPHAIKENENVGHHLELAACIPTSTTRYDSDYAVCSKFSNHNSSHAAS